MARMTCRCGKVLSNSSAPNDVQYRVYSDFEWDGILQKDVYNSWEIPLPKLDVWKCPACERLYIFDEKNELIRVYSVEA